MLLVFALLIVPVALVLAVVTIDASFLQSERRGAQKTADLAALAAAKELPVSDASVINVGLDYAKTNGYDDADDAVEVIVTPRYNGNPNLVEVVIDSESATLFAGIFGFLLPNHGARAVAEYAQTNAPYAIFANDTRCNQDTLKFSGSDATIDGRVHTNGRLEVSGQNNDFEASVTHRCSNPPIHGSTDFPPGSPQQLSATIPMPVEYRLVRPGGSGPTSGWPSSTTAVWQVENVRTGAIVDCTRKFNSDVNLNSFVSGGVLAPGVYCSKGKIDLSRSNTTGNVTLVGMREIVLSGSNFRLTPHWDNLLLFTTFNGSSAMDAAGQGGRWEGIIYVPNGRAKINGSDGSSGSLEIYGSIVAFQVDISGQNFTITAAFTGGADAELRLVE